MNKIYFITTIISIFHISNTLPINEDINVANLQKLASLNPQELQLMLHYLENPFIATALVERDKNRRTTPNPGPIPEAFNEPAESSNLENFLIQKSYERRGRPHTRDEALRDPIIGPYFTGGLKSS